MVDYVYVILGFIIGLILSLPLMELLFGDWYVLNLMFYHLVLSFVLLFFVGFLVFKEVEE